MYMSLGDDEIFEHQQSYMIVFVCYYLAFVNPTGHCDFLNMRKAVDLAILIWYEQGEPLCIFYSRYGICKFGPSCKFDHPMGIFTYNLSAASSPNVPVQHLFGTSSGSTALNLSSEGLVEAGSAKPRRLSLSETREMPSDDENIDAEDWASQVIFTPFTIFWKIKRRRESYL